MIKFTAHTDKFIKSTDLEQKVTEAKKLLPKIKADSMAGWLDLPVSYDDKEIARIKAAASKINQDSKYLVCIGIGGSYIGYKAIIEALGSTGPTKILYAGNSLSPLELRKVIDEVGNADFSINVISKSGTTTETMIAFRTFKQQLIEKYGLEKAKSRIYATTEANQAALHQEAIAAGYETFIVPSSIGDRYSMLDALRFLPLVVAGIDIDEFINGAKEAYDTLAHDGGIAVQYAVLRNALYTQNFNIEILASFEPALTYFHEWWKQLFGESEGKAGKGIFPASVVNTTDLHSMGQYIQDGRRNLIETFINIDTPTAHISVPTSPENLDELQYLEGKELSYINDQALVATKAAHLAGGVPVLEITLPDLSARNLGSLIYFFELSCALSGSLLGVNPFDQPGVEAYKTEMFRLLGKPGY